MAIYYSLQTSVSGFAKLSFVALVVLLLGTINESYVNFFDLNKTTDLLISFFNYKFLVVLTLVLMAKVAIMLVYLFFKKCTKQEINLTLLIAVSLSFPFIINFGTNGGLVNITSGCWFLAPVLIILALLCELEGKFVKAFYQAAGLVVVLCILKLYSSFYREDNNIFNLSKEIEVPKLQHIYTTPQRAKSYQDMVNESQKYIKANDVVFAFDFNPMFYWVTNTRAFVDISWPHIYNYQFLKSKLENLCPDRRPLVKLIILSKVGLFDGYWPTSKIKVETVTRDLPKIEFINSLVLNHCLVIKVWENDAFTLYLPEKIAAS
jgi:hypothetical protein